MNNGYYTAGEKEFLLKIARKSLEKFLLEGEKFEPQTINRKLWEKRGVFVAVNQSRKPQKYIGNIKPVKPLILAVRDNTLSAASDIRSDFLKTTGISRLEIEILILSELKKVALGDIQPGTGVLVKRGDKKATYLPQVWKTLADKNKFIFNLCEKAGFDPSFGDDPATEFWIYRVSSFK